MIKRDRKKISRQQTAARRVTSKKPPAAERNHCLDTLRGFAILLMVVDHVAGILLDFNIEPTNIRIATRLSMPLFCVLMGYFLATAEEIHWNRYFQLLLATLIINSVFFSLYGKVEVLASLLVCYTTYILIRYVLTLQGGFAFLFVAAFFYQQDPSVPYFDYPVSVVATCVAQGVILKRHGLPVATATGFLALLAFAFVDKPTAYVIYFVVPATLMVAWSSKHPQLRLKWLELPGRFPLTTYLAQYLIILAIGRLS